MSTDQDPFERAVSALDSAGVQWCRLRERDGGEEDDLLVATDDLRRARRALAEVAFVERRHPGRGTHRAFVSYDADADRWPKVDVVTALDYGRWQEFRTELASGVLARRRDRGEPAPDDAFWTLLLHEVLDRSGQPPARRERLRAMAAGARPDGELAMWVAGLLPSGTSPAQVIAMAASEDVDGLIRLGRTLAQGWMRRAPVATTRRRVVARIVRRLDHLDPPFVRRGISITLLGPDGTGKSSLAGRLGRGGPIPTRSVYLGLYGGARKTARRNRSRVRVPGLGTARRLVAMWRGWCVGWWHVRRGRIVVFDRHPYDARLGGRSGVTGRLGRAILGRAVPGPDAVVVLDAPAELLFARKPEHPVVRLSEQRAAYLALATRLPSATVVDVSGPLDLVTNRVTEIVWARFAERSRGR